MTIDGTRDPLGRLPIADDYEPVCESEHHWSGWRCEAEADHTDPHRSYMNGARAEWRTTQSPVMLRRQGGES